jgi:hypothetical protein
MAKAMKEGMEDIQNDVLKSYKDNDGYLDIKLTIEGHEIDFRAFCERWQSDIRRQIKEKAKELVNLNFIDMYDVLYDLEQRMKEEVAKRMEEWEKEDETTRA